VLFEVSARGRCKERERERERERESLRIGKGQLVASIGRPSRARSASPTVGRLALIGLQQSGALGLRAGSPALDGQRS